MREIYVNRDKVINILDKYKAESEELGMTEIEREQNKKNCNNCKYGYLSLICKKPNTEMCGNNFSQWVPIPKLYKAESEDKE